MSLRLDEIASRTRWNGFTGRIRPAGHSLETAAIKKNFNKGDVSFKLEPSTHATVNGPMSPASEGRPKGRL